MIKINIRNISPEEFKELRKELIDIYKASYHGLEEYSYTKNSLIKNYLNWLYRGDPAGFFVAFENKRIVGFASARKHWFWAGKLWGEIHEIVVDPGIRRKGVGTSLMKKVIKYLKAQRHERIGFWVGTDNTAAKKFYENLDFVPEATSGKWERWVLTPLKKKDIESS